jgi:hypothetical protein
MPLVVLVVFYALLRVHKQPGALAGKQPAAAQGAGAAQP